MVEKFYKIKNDKLDKEVVFYKNESKKRNELIISFFKTHGIEGSEYYISGNGFCNTPFEEEDKMKIILCISEENADKFAQHLKKKSICPRTVQFKKSSKILKEFQQKCVEKKIIINLERIRVGEYFEELQYGGYSTDGLYEKDGDYYLKISTTKFETLTPNTTGFEEIKGSEFYKIKEGDVS